MCNEDLVTENNSLQDQLRKKKEEDNLSVSSDSDLEVVLAQKEEERKLIVPRGMDISWLENHFGEQAVVDRKCDEFTNCEQIPIKYLTKDERQANLLKFLLGEGQYYYTKSKSQLSCNSTTGSGKTFVTVAAICFSGSRAIIITNSIQWLNQWKERIMEYTPLTEKDIYMIARIGSINKLLCRNPLDYKIFLASHSTIKSYGDKHGWNAVSELFKYLVNKYILTFNDYRKHSIRERLM